MTTTVAALTRRLQRLEREFEGLRARLTDGKFRLGPAVDAARATLGSSSRSDARRAIDTFATAADRVRHAEDGLDAAASAVRRYLDDVTSVAAQDARVPSAPSASPVSLHDFSEFVTEGSPSAGARLFQSGPLYPHADEWTDTVAQVGDRFFVGEPGAGRFVVPEAEVSKADGSARRYYEGVQVGPREGPDGHHRYRGGGLQGYEVVKPLPWAESVARANIQFGDGGFSQRFLPKTLTDLEASGYIRKVHHLPLDDIEASIPSGGRHSPAPEEP
ncbi:hypothetical protein [Modestobacter sp. VKM Ac-2984]|uniref:hypothetical protein n=1 Tax=Modestobacter sp. VKM Ac-2984 TaxID=3004138 RepID=UPI0022AAEB93|nr:hypothetical protein [Modestobacter sp. VKM Ac-2984]MCZ2817267.1 hypothetical protein [Modestobacter sp. VKM Ac-2984]